MNICELLENSSTTNTLSELSEASAGYEAKEHHQELEENESSKTHDQQSNQSNLSSSSSSSTTPDGNEASSSSESENQATINLSAGSNGGSAITSYTYTVNDSEPVTIASISSPLVFTNLEVGIVYLFQIKATNSVGDSSNTTTSFTGMSVPDAPVIIGATAGNKSIVVEFFAPNANSSTITSYNYSIASGVYTSATLLDASHISITGLSENTEYTIKLAAVNAIGQSDDSNTASATPYTYPLSPTIGTITVDNGSASVEFTARSDNSSAITAYSYSLNNGSYITYSSVEIAKSKEDLII